MSEYVDAFTSYRQQYERQTLERHSLETAGITYSKAFQAAMADPRTIRIPIDGIEMPLLTPLGNLPDRNLELYWGRATEESGRPVGELYYYSHLGLSEAEAGIIAQAQALRDLAVSGAVIAYDCAASAAERTDAEVRALWQRIGGIAVTEVGGMPQHYHYLMLLRGRENSGRAMQPLDFPQLYRMTQADYTVRTRTRIEVTTKLSESDVAHVAGYYADRHKVLTDADATEAGFSPESLRGVLTDGRSVKILYRTKGEVANLTILADVRDCPWIDQVYARHHYPDQYDRGRMLVAIGAISDPAAPEGLSRWTVSMGGRLIAYAGGDVALGIATDDVSNAYVPHLTVQLLRSRSVGLDLQMLTPASTATEAVASSPRGRARQAVAPTNGVLFRAHVLSPAV